MVEVYTISLSKIQLDAPKTLKERVMLCFGMRSINLDYIHTVELLTRDEPFPASRFTELVQDLYEDSYDLGAVVEELVTNYGFTRPDVTTAKIRS